MGVVTRGMGGTGCLGGVREGARAAAARGAAARASGEELGKVTVGGNETGVSGTSVARARGADAGASAKRGALVPAEGDEHHRSTRRRVGATKETTVDDLPVRLPSARLVVPAHGGVLLPHSFQTATTATTARPRPSRADPLIRSSRFPPRADAGPPARGGLRPPRRGLEAARVLRRHAHVRPPRAFASTRDPRNASARALVFRETQRKTKTVSCQSVTLRPDVVRRRDKKKETPRFFF